MKIDKNTKEIRNELNLNEMEQVVAGTASTPPNPVKAIMKILTKLFGD